jgi:hypothetical protein
MGTALLVFALFAGPAKAHEDRILHVNADGSIPAIPAKFGNVRLVMNGLGTKRPFVQLRIGAHRTTLPFCVTQMIRTASPAEIPHHMLTSLERIHDETASEVLQIPEIDPEDSLAVCPAGLSCYTIVWLSCSLDSRG